MKESFQATITDVGGTLNMIPFDFDNDVTPRVWFGYFDEDGTGIRARYWEYDHSANPLSAAASFTTFPGVSSVSVIFPAAISTAAPGDVLNVNSGLDVYTLDIEGVQKADAFGMNITASVGFRYASMKQYFSSSVVRGPATIGSLNWTREFEGGGLIAGGEARKSLGGSALSLVGSARGSLLYGEKTLQRTTVNDITPVGSRVSPNVILEDADEVSGIFELTAGLEWSRATKIGELYFRGSYETQLWTAAGAPTLTFLGFDGIGLSIGLVR